MKTGEVIDIISSLVPHGGTFAPIIKAWWDKRFSEAREIYLSEIRNGTFDNIDTDDILSICHRLHRAISEGIAKNNFRLLCRLVQGLGDNRKLTAQTFIQFASILDSLSSEEIKVLAYDVWLYRNPNPRERRIDSGYNVTNKELETERARYITEIKTWETAYKKFVESLHLDTNRIEQIHYALLRTGLYELDIIPEAYIEHHEAEYKGPGESWNLVDAGTKREFSFSDIMQELMTYIDFSITHID